MELKVISLENCYYSNTLENLLSSNNIKNNLIKVNYSTKNEYKTDKYYTFPQVYFNDKLIGGLNEFNSILNLVKDKKDLNSTIIKIKELIIEKNINKKFILQLIDYLL